MITMVDTGRDTGRDTWRCFHICYFRVAVCYRAANIPVRNGIIYSIHHLEILIFHKTSIMSMHNACMLTYTCYSPVTATSYMTLSKKDKQGLKKAVNKVVLLHFLV